MKLPELLARIAISSAADWSILFRPTFRHRLTERRDQDGKLLQMDVDEHLVAFSFKPDVSLTMAYGLVEQGAVELPPGHPFATENARSVYADVFFEGRLAHREVVLKIDRQRCIVPFPHDWTPPVKISPARYRFVRLIHDLAGPPTDFEDYFKRCGMVQDADGSWI